MTDERHRAVMRILAEALDCPPDTRAALLDRLCDGDQPLRRAVEVLLARQSAAEQFLEDPIVEIADARADDEASLIGQSLGAYRITDEIGRGGMGAVYLAVRDDDAYHRRVAIKLIKRGMDTDAIQRRFRRERQILANLDHHHIARLFDGGAAPDGRPYLVMEYVAGVSIVQYAEEGRLDEAGRLTLFLKVCQAVHYAHQHQVVHGDIKPANILVTEEGVPKLLDFGVARILNPAPSPLDAPTGAWRAMTPEYASPEQRHGEPITAASDVYSLGAVLYELIAGRRAAGEAPARGREPLKGDLEVIVTMAMRDEPERRYASANALADDVWRYLEGLPVTARKDTLVYRGGTFVKRHKTALVATAAVAVVCLLLGMLLTWVAMHPARTTSLAVLPFSATGGDSSSTMLAEGMTDGLIGSFMKLPALGTPGRDSVGGFTGPSVEPLAAARALHVDALLMGRVSAGPDRVSIDASLFDAARREVIWQQHYDASSSELLALQDQIVADVSRRIGLDRQTDVQVRPQKRHTQNDAAYRHYLMGQHFLNMRVNWALKQSIDQFNLAIAADRQFAPAYVGLSYCFGLLGAYLDMPSAEAFTPARSAALAALAIDDELADAHTALAFTVWLYDWDWAKADHEFRRAITLEPRNVRAHHWYGLFLGEMARFDEAEAQEKLALELDPLSAPVWADLGRVYFWARRYDKAREMYKQAFEMGAPGRFLPDAKELYERTDPEAFLQALITMKEIDEPLVRIYREQGPAAYWRASVKWAGNPRQGLIWQAELFARVGDKDRAFESLEIVFGKRSDHRLSQLRVNPVFDSLRDDPRFDALLRKMHLD